MPFRIGRVKDVPVLLAIGVIGELGPRCLLSFAAQPFAKQLVQNVSSLFRKYHPGSISLVPEILRQVFPVGIQTGGPSSHRQGALLVDVQ